MEVFLGLSFIIIFFIILPLFLGVFMISLVYHGAKKLHEDRQTLVDAARTIVEKNKA